MLFELFSWSMVVASLTGVVLNIRGNSGCWYVWAVSNIGWIVVGAATGLYSLVALQTVYMLMNIWGIMAWKEHRNELTKLRQLAAHYRERLPMTAEEADEAYSDAEADPISDEELDRLVDLVTKKGERSGM